MDTRNRPAASAPASQYQVCDLCSVETQGQGKLIACGETFCSECLLELVLTQGGSSTVACPICHQASTLHPTRAQEPPAPAFETTASAPSRAIRIRRKGDGLMIQLYKQICLLHATVGSKEEDQRQKGTALCGSLYGQATRDFLALQRDALRVSHALDAVTAAVASRNTLALLDAASGNAALGGVMTGRPARSLAPTLRVARSADTETLGKFLGEASHVEVQADFTPETADYMCQVGDRKGGPREIKWITPYHTSDDAEFLCRGATLSDPLIRLHSMEEAQWSLAVNLTFGEVKDEGQVGVVEFGTSRRFHPLGWPRDGACWLHLSKTEPQLALSRQPSGAVAVCSLDILGGEEGDYNEKAGDAVEVVVKAGAVAFEIDAVHPTAFDASICGEFIAVVEAASAEDSAAMHPSEKSEVRLYMARGKKAVGVYRPHKLPFCPSDICFLEEKCELKLLISDWHQDLVHVVAVTRSGGLQFQRHLSAADGDLVKPTALNTDTSGGVWVGCSTGAVLRYSQRDITL